MPIWYKEIDVEQVNLYSKKSMVEAIGIDFIEIGDNFIRARMPVDQRTIQPAGILHGGASVALAETLGSVAANLCVDDTKHVCVGLEINANHIRSMRSGWVFGIATPVHLGSTTQIWDIRITNQQDQLVCISRLTMAVLSKG
ncbi:MAG: hotdog fold thioesterase [Omnitrophica WOR_2 bacterium]